LEQSATDILYVGIDCSCRVLGGRSLQAWTVDTVNDLE